MAFIVYANFRMFENAHYQMGPYLSPFYSPLIDTSWAKGWPVPISGAMLILAGPLSFRFTCYYYRKAYYRAFAMDPPACAVGKRSRNYNGERKLMVFQNLHRFALYVAIAFLFFLWHDGVHFNVGTLVLTINASLLTGYTLGCHAFRHLVGGNVNSYSTAALGGLRYSLWKGVTKLNERHMAFAWASLLWVGFTDFYIRSVDCHWFTDVRFF
jgi:hypothetical protein